MDEWPRGSEMPRGGIRKFMNDPKSSVMSYLAENMAAQHIQSQSPQQNNGSSISQQSSSPYGQQQYGNQGSNGLSSQFQSHSNASVSSLAQSQPGQNGGVLQSLSPQSSITHPAHNVQIPPITPYLASNIASSSIEANPGAQAADPQSQQQGAQVQLSGQLAGSELSMTNLGKMPPTSGLKQSNLPQSAPRHYHRMVLDFEIAKNTFFLAKAQHNSQEMTATAYDLESLSRRIWSLRFEHAWEFEGFQESGHQAVIATWQAQYELWADTVLDIQEGDSAASMFSVHRPPSIGGISVEEMPSTDVIAPASGTSTNASSQFQQSRLSGMSVSPPGQIPFQEQQVPDFQHVPTGLGMPNSQYAQSPPLKYMPPNGIPGGYASTGTLPSATNPARQPVPVQQQSSNLPFQKPDAGRIGSMSNQTLPPSTGLGVQRDDNRPSNTQPNMQQGPPEQSFPQQIPTYQSPPQHIPPEQMQGEPARMQQPPYTLQRPPSGISNPNMMPPSQMPNLVPGQNQSSWSNLPPGVR